jgi:cation diffusion facilitator family transporter
MSAADRRTFTRAAWVNVVGNVLKILVEGSVGLAFGSLALLADAAHSLADLLASGVVLVGGRLSYEAPDASHPHGHERIEPLTALFVGATLVVLAAKLLADATTALLVGSEVVFSYILVGGLTFAIVDMALVYWYTRRANRELGSPGLNALAVDSLNDVYTSMAAVIGVFGVAAGYPVLDAVAGGFVALLVGYQGISVARENVAYLVGRAPPEYIRAAVRETIRSHPAVVGLHDVRIYYIGAVLEVEFHAEVNGELTLREAHDIETELGQRVRDVEGVGDAHVHLDPSGVGEWKEAGDGERDVRSA